MEFKLVFLVVASLFACAACYECNQSDWAKYKEEFNKSYELAEQDLFHFNTFCENLIIIKQQNHDYDIGEVNHKLSVTKFSDLSPPEQQALLKSSKKRRGGSKARTEETE